MIEKRLFPCWVMLLIVLSVTVGCSTVHEVSVVSHGDEMAPAKEVAAEPEAMAPSALPEVEQDQNKLIALAPISLPPTPPVSNPLVERDIYAQSAEDITLPWTLQDVFFDYDQVAIRSDAIPLIEQNAKVLLKRYPDRAVLIQGHCDERGTEAYNLILGERRASAVKNYLVNLGVLVSRLRVLSLGKSQPFCPERSMRCFQSNRRAHFVLR